MTKILFRKDKNTGEIIAVFPYIPWDSAKTLCTCYAHVGQHASCDWLYVRCDTRNAEVSEYFPLLEEVQCQGYNDLEVLKRLPPYRCCAK